MQPIAEFGATRDVAITILMDNRADLIVKSTKTIKYLILGVVGATYLFGE